MASTWEERMATRAHDRQTNHKAVEDRRWAREWASLVREERQLQARMTLGEARELLTGPTWACACTGFPNCCVYRSAQARALQRGAHIVAKLIASVGEP